jgi:hypothetical protein
MFDWPARRKRCISKGVTRFGAPAIVVKPTVTSAATIGA